MRRTTSLASFRVLIGALLVAFALIAPATAWADTKIAVIDLRRAVADTEDGLRVQAELQQLFDSRQSAYESKEKDLEELKKELETLQKSGASEAELRKKYAVYEKMAYELQSLQVNTRREMQVKEQELMLPIIKQLLSLVRHLASQNSYDMVLNKEMVPYFRSDLDITDRIIQMYNARSMGDGAEPSPSPGKKAPRGGAPGKRPGAKTGPPKK